MQVKEARSLHNTSTGNARCFKAFSNKKRRHVITWMVITGVILKKR